MFKRFSFVINLLFFITLSFFSFQSCKFESHQSLCGNNQIEPGEECDGNPITDKLCSFYGFEGGNLKCTNICTLDFSECDGYLETCGNNIIDDDEECDGLSIGTKKCQDLGYQGGTLMCTKACTFDISMCTDCTDECNQNKKRCDNNSIYECQYNENSKCNEWIRITDCSETNNFCSETAYGDVFCSSNCSETCIKDTTRCSMDYSKVETCTQVENGCLIWTETSCDNHNICSEINGDATCISQNICTSECNPQTTLTQCTSEGDGIEYCTEIEQDCFKWQKVTTCNEGYVCWLPVTDCIEQTDGKTCNTAIYISSLNFTLDGTDFNEDYPIDNNLPISCTDPSEGGRIYLKKYLLANKAIRFSYNSIDKFKIGIITDCNFETNCIINTENTEFSFISPSDGTYIFVATASSTALGAYSFNITEIPILNETEPCLPNESTGVCITGTFCGINNQSPTGTSCLSYPSGDLCSMPIQATEGDNNGMMQGLTDTIDASSMEGNIEQIWIFTPTEDATYLIKMKNFPFYSNVYIKTNCNDATDLAYANADFSQDASLVVMLNANENYYIFCEKTYPIASFVNPYYYTLQIMKVQNENSTLCGDGLDNNLNGLIDCSDPMCFGESTFCSTETNCIDGQDNDNDGLTDCEDSDCNLDINCIQKAGIYEVFNTTNPPDLNGYTLTFSPNGLTDYTLNVNSDATYIYPSDNYNTISTPVGDDQLYTYILPFDFQFYGITYSEIYVSSNGWMSFTPKTESSPFEEVSVLFSSPYISVMWDDLNKIHSSDNFIIMWSQESSSSEKWWSFIFYTREYNYPSHILNAQVILFDDGTIIISYIQNTISDGIVGISNPGNDPIPLQTNLIP